MSIQIRSTYDAVYNSMFSEQDDLAGSADEPLAMLLWTGCASFAECKLLDSATNGVRNPDVVICGKSD